MNKNLFNENDFVTIEAKNIFKLALKTEYVLNKEINTKNNINKIINKKNKIRIELIKFAQKIENILKDDDE